MSRLVGFTTVRVGGEAETVIVKDASALKFRGDEVVIGRGSKVLISDKGLGKVLIMRNVGASVRGNLITAESGTPLPLLSRIAAESGLSGLEWACGIPGSLGGGIVMNAGAYGGEISDVLVSADVLTSRGRVTVSAKELDPTYRKMRGLPHGVILSATLALTAGSLEVKNLMRLYAEKRRASQPSGHNFGSTFRKIGGVSAGYFIEKAGLKGYAVGKAHVSEKHANFIINDGDSASDIRALIDIIKLKVYAACGERLTEEVIYLGEF